MSLTPDCVHISSLIVFCRPEKLSAVVEGAKAFENLEVVIQDEAGKLVLLLETESEKEIMSVVDGLRDIDGVLSTSMVYHEVDLIENNREIA